MDSPLSVRRISFRPAGLASICVLPVVALVVLLVRTRTAIEDDNGAWAVALVNTLPLLFLLIWAGMALRAALIQQAGKRLIATLDQIDVGQVYSVLEPRHLASGAHTRNQARVSLRDLPPKISGMIVEADRLSFWIGDSASPVLLGEIAMSAIASISVVSVPVGIVHVRGIRFDVNEPGQRPRLVQVVPVTYRSGWFRAANLPDFEVFAAGVRANARPIE